MILKLRYSACDNIIVVVNDNNIHYNCINTVQIMILYCEILAVTLLLK